MGKEGRLRFENVGKGRGEKKYLIRKRDDIDNKREVKRLEMGK